MSTFERILGKFRSLEVERIGRYGDDDPIEFADPVSIERLSLGGARTKEHLETVNRYEDDGAFQLDLSGYDYDEFVFDGLFQHDTIGTTDWLGVQINEVTTTDYWFVDDGSVTTGATEIRWLPGGVASNRQGRFVMYIGVDPSITEGLQTPTVGTVLPGVRNNSSANGILTTDQSGISTVDFIEEDLRPKRYKFEVYGLSEVGTQ